MNKQATYVCTDCQIAQRAEAAYHYVHPNRCKSCGKPTWELSYRRRIPKQGDEKGWKELALLVWEEQQEFIPRRHQRGHEQLSALEKKQTALQQNKKMPAEMKLKKLKYLAWQKRKVIEKHFENPEDLLPNEKLGE